MSTRAAPIVLDDDDVPDAVPHEMFNIIPPTSPLPTLTDTPGDRTPTASRDVSPTTTSPLSNSDEAMEVDAAATAGQDDGMDVDGEEDENDGVEAEPADGEDHADADSESESSEEEEAGEGDETRAEEDITHSPKPEPEPEPGEADLPPETKTAAIDVEPPAATNGKSSTPATEASATLAVPKTPTKKPSSTKPKSKRQLRSPTPPPKPPQPLETVRLTIKLDASAKGATREYAFDIAKLAEEKGVRIRPAQPATKIDTDESEDDAAMGSAEEKARAFEDKAKELDNKPKKRKRKRGEEQYDLEDDFIDDSELAIEERKFFAQTKQTGFYVSSGEVALLREKTEPGKRSPKKPTAAAATKDDTSSKDGSTAAGAPKKKTKEEPVPPPEHPPGIPLADKPKPRRSALARTLAALPGESHARESPAIQALVRPIEMPPPLPSTKPRRASLSTPDASVVVASDEDEPAAAGGEELRGGRGTKRKASMAGEDAGTPGDGDMVAEPRKRRKTIVELPPFSPALMPDLEMLRKLVEREEEAFSIRGKFPQHVKPVLASVALKAIALDEYDEDFFDAMPKIFPYNRYTMKKLIARTVYKQHTELLSQRSDELVADLKAIVDKGFKRAQEEHAKAISAWETRQAKKRADSSAAAEVAPPVAVAADDATAGEREDKPPQQKYKLTEAMRIIIWNLVCLSNDIATLTQEKNNYENVKEVVSEQGMRKLLYQKIQACFPENWMNTGILSREVSSLKKKQGRENMAELPEP